MRIKTNIKTVEEYCQYFNSRVTYYKAFTNYAIYFKPRGEYYGNIEGTNIWIVKTKSLVGSLPQRYFQGKLLEDSDGISVEGKFRFTNSVYTWFIFTVVISSFILMSSFPYQSLPCQPYTGILITVVVVAGFPLAIPGIGYLTSMHLEKAVIDFLKVS